MATKRSIIQYPKILQSSLGSLLPVFQLLFNLKLCGQFASVGTNVTSETEQ